MILQVPELWIAAVAAIIPLLTALAVRKEGTNATRALIAVAASATLAVVETAIGDGATVEGYLSTFVTVLITQLVSYSAVLAPLFRINETVFPTVGIGGGDQGGMSAG